MTPRQGSVSDTQHRWEEASHRLGTQHKRLLLFPWLRGRPRSGKIVEKSVLVKVFPVPQGEMRSVSAPPSPARPPPPPPPPQSPSKEASK